MPDIKIISKLVDIELEKLHVQYVPVVTPLELWNHDMSLINSPHVELLKIIYANGFNWPLIMKSRFVQVRQHRAIMGLDQWTDEKIQEHIKQRWKIYKSLSKYQFVPKMSRGKPVIVLKKPFWTTRFGFKADWLGGWEIWDGMRRCSAQHFIGRKTIKGYFAEDTKPGSKDRGKFGKKLEKVEGVWSD